MVVAAIHVQIRVMVPFAVALKVITLVMMTELVKVQWFSGYCH